MLHDVQIPPRYRIISAPKVREQPLSVDHGWLVANAENGIGPRYPQEELEKLLLNDGLKWPPLRCAFSGECCRHWSGGFHNIVPRAENYIPSQGLWLRVNGCMPCDREEANRIKLSLCNRMYLQNTLGKSMNYHYKGVIFLLTLQEACKFEALCEAHLFEKASKEQSDTSFEYWKSTQMATDSEAFKWHRNMTTYEKKEHLVISQQTPIYECTMFVVHKEEEPSLNRNKSLSADERKDHCTERIEITRDMKGRTSSTIDQEERWEWRAEVKDGTDEVEHILPRPVFRTQYERRTNRKRRTVPIKKAPPGTRFADFDPADQMDPEEPKMCIPIEPVSSTLVFVTMMEELQGEGWECSSYLQKLMKVLKWILVLAESATPRSMWDKCDAHRHSELDEMPVMPGEPPNANDTIRHSHFKFEMYRSNFFDHYRRRNSDGISGPSGKVPHKDLFRSRTSSDPTPNPTTLIDRQPGHTESVWYVSQFKSWCGASKEDIPSVFENDYSPTEECDLYQTCDHADCYDALDMVEDCSVSLLAKEAKLFQERVLQIGLQDALEMLRCHPSNKEEFMIVKERKDQIEKMVYECEGDCGAVAREAGLLKADLGI